MRPDEVLDTLQRAGFEAWYVGGCVRDTLLGRPIHDWDVTTSALPEQALALFPRTAPSPSCRTAAPSRSQPTAPMGTTMMAATRTASALSARCARIPPGAISPSTQWRWISAETYAISTEAEPISQRAFCAASARRSAASARMRCGCCARAVSRRSSVFPSNRPAGTHFCAARRSASGSHASASPKKLRKRSAHRPRSGPLR